MSRTWSTKHRPNHQAPSTPRTPASSQSERFYPPSYYAEAAGIPYPPTRPEASERQGRGFSPVDAPSGTPHVRRSKSTHHSPSSSSSKEQRRRSRASPIDTIETQLLPTLKDTIERMTRPPSQISMAAEEDMDERPLARAQSVASKASSAASSSYLQRPHIPPRHPDRKPTKRESRAHFHHEEHVPSNSPIPPPTTPTSLRTGRLASKKLPSTSSEESVPRRNTSYDQSKIASSVTRKSGKKCSADEKAEKTPQMSLIGSPRKFERMRSQTEPATFTTPKSTNPPSFIPVRRGGNMASRTRTRRVAFSGETESDVDSPSDSAVAEMRQRKLVVANAVVVPSSSSESEKSIIGVFPKPPTSPAPAPLPPPAAQEEQTEASVQRSGSRGSRFGLGLGLSGYSLRFKSMFADAMKSESSSTVTASGKGQGAVAGNASGASPFLADLTPKPPHPFTRDVHSEDSDNRRKRELLGLFDRLDAQQDAFPASLGFETDHSIQEGLAFSGSGDCSASKWPPSRPQVDDSASEYSSDDHGDADEEENGSLHLEGDMGISLTRHIGPSRIPRLPSSREELRSVTSLSQRTGLQNDIGALNSRHSLISDVEMDETVDEVEQEPPAAAGSMELEKLAGSSSVAAAREREAFGIPHSVSDGLPTSDSLVSHAESWMSSVSNESWRDDYDDSSGYTGRLLKHLSVIQPEMMMKVTHDDAPDEGDAVRPDEEHDESDSPISADDPRDAERLSPPYASPLEDFPTPSITEPPLLPSVSWLSGNSPTFAAQRFAGPHADYVKDEDISRTLSDSSSWDDFRRVVVGEWGDAEAVRQEVIWELTETEVDFVNRQQNVIDMFIRPLRVQDSKKWVSGIPADITRLLDWLEDIVNLHVEIVNALLDARNQNQSVLLMVSHLLRPHVTRFEIYQPYLAKLEYVAAMIEQLLADDDSDFGMFVKLQESSIKSSNWTLERYLVEPVNRLSQYPDIFRRLLHATPKHHPDYVSMLSLFMSSRLVIRVLSEVKDREDEYELVKTICSHIRSMPFQVASRERRLLYQGTLNLSKSDMGSHGDRMVVEPSDSNLSSISDKVKVTGRTVLLSRAVEGLRGRSSSVKSTSSTATSVKSFRSAPSSFEIPREEFRQSMMDSLPAAPLTVQVLLFSDLLVLASALGTLKRQSLVVEEIDWQLLDEIGITKIVAVRQREGSPNTVELDVIQVENDNNTTESLIGSAEDPPLVTTVSLSASSPNAMNSWLPRFHESCQSTLRALASLTPSSSNDANRGSSADIRLTEPSPDLLDPKVYHESLIKSITDIGLPIPKSPSMQIYEEDSGAKVGSQQREREERGWWSVRFHRVMRELETKEVPSPA
ncbi:hypothetical protein CONPUDRAFT_157153 [Coniophora puteana RWD-64-598 SS2]|uniref:DH domain-containing protein n=1 Tax=Coniophora puteana (strain RWD-64-598) TaxID=741705 RepID=A0A5M3MFJ2_CONPW|nr:uncharacterized protein CONPUDRAFT_157153 [Coniophora puteana RWD-64-598 SS2]EIW77982.1 hypothetical protein CONPUDRAFT_157153 [Coniophora puteana RWD-64-598 SS2]